MIHTFSVHPRRTGLGLATLGLAALALTAAHPAAAQTTIYNFQAGSIGDGPTYTGAGIAGIGGPASTTFNRETYTGGITNQVGGTGYGTVVDSTGKVNTALIFRYDGDNINHNGSYSNSSDPGTLLQLYSGARDAAGAAVSRRISLTGLTPGAAFTAIFYAENGNYQDGRLTNFTLTNSSFTPYGPTAVANANSGSAFKATSTITSTNHGNYVKLSGTTDSSGGIYATYVDGGNSYVTGVFNGAQFAIPRVSSKVQPQLGEAALPLSTPAEVAAPSTSNPPVHAETYVWKSEVPKDCPFPPSKNLPGIVFTDRHAEYTTPDTWYPSWASDGNLYSPWTDGVVNGLGSDSSGRSASTGSAKIIGDDPLKLQVVDQNVYSSDPSPYAGRYPCGSLVYNGVWYYGTYCLSPSGRVNHEGTDYNWPWLGPFVGFRYSTNFGKTWTQTPCTPEKPLFGEEALTGDPVKIGSPHFVDFGKNMQHSPDGKAYLIAHGASDGKNRRFGYNSWITGDEIYLLRVTPGITNMNDASKYEFFTGRGSSGQPRWSRKLSEAKPIAAWRDNMGCVTMTYDAPIRKYLMCVTDGNNTTGYFNSYILESNLISGPFKLVQYLHHFGGQAYFVNIPSKFISADGRALWLCYSANFAVNWNGMNIESNPVGSHGGMCLHEINLVKSAK